MARLTRSLIVGAALAGFCTAALADPSFFAAIIINAFGTSVATALAIGTFITTYGVAIAGLAFSALGASQARKKQRRAAAAQRAAYNASLADRNITVLSAEAPRQVVYGQPAPLGGAIVAVLTSGTRDQYKHVVLVLAAHESESIDEVYFEGEAVGLATRDGSDWMTAAPFAKTEQVSVTETITIEGSGSTTITSAPTTTISKRYVGTTGSGGGPEAEGPTEVWAYDVVTTEGSTTVTGTPGTTATITYTTPVTTSYLRIKPHLGTAGEAADAYLLANVPAKWTAAHKLSGYTYLSITMDLTLDRFQGGSLAFSVKMKGKKVYDPRSTLTAYSRNPALCIGDFLRSNMGFSATLAQLDSAAWIAAANACDVADYTSNAESGYSTARYTADGVFRTDQDREGVLQMLEDAMAGATHQSGGVWRIMAGAWASPAMALTDADSAGPIQITQASFSAKQRWNGLRGQYVEGSRLGVPEDFKLYSNATFLAADGVARITDKNFPLTSAIQRCQHLATIEVERSRLGLTIQYPAHLRAWPLQPGDRVSITNAEFGWSAKTFRVTDWAFSVSSPVALELVEDVAAVWDLADAVVLDDMPNTGLPDPWVVEALAGLTAYSGQDELLAQADGTVVSRVRLTWTQAAGRYVNQGGSVRVRYKRASLTSDLWTEVVLSGDSTTVTVDGVQDAVGYIFAARFEANVGGQGVALGAFTYLDHYVIGKSEPPEDVPWFVSNGQSLSWGAVGDVDVAGYRIRYQPGQNFSWGNAVELHSGLLTAPPFVTGIVTGGQVTIMIKAVDTSGNESENVAFIVTDLGDALVANVVETIDLDALGYPGTVVQGALDAGDLKANDATDTMWDENDGASMWTFDTQDMWQTQYYYAMYYLAQINPTQSGLGSRMTLAHTIVADNYAIEYRRNGPAPMWKTLDTELMWASDDATLQWSLPPGDFPATMWSSDPTLMWSGDADTLQWTVLAGGYLPWPGDVQVVDEPYDIRVTTGYGTTRGVISALTFTIDMPDIVERFDDIVISSGGTRLTLTNTYREISNVLITVQNDGNGAVGARIEDKSFTLGPLIKTINDAGSAVNGLIDATIQGF